MSGFRNRLLIGDIRQRLNEIPAGSADCVISSPPYYLLRDYGVSGQLGLESSVEVWIDEMRLALGGLTRVLKPTGSLWLNLGDSYSRHAKYGAARKSLFLAPERLLLALAGDGWIVRNKCIWFKTNPMPHSVSDRLSNSYDVVYFLTRSPRYFFDLDAIRLPHRSQPTTARPSEAVYPPAGSSGPIVTRDEGGNKGLAGLRRRGVSGHEFGKNPGDVWPLPGANYRGAHFATFPPRLVERPLLATCPERICNHCSRPWRRSTRSRQERLSHGHNRVTPPGVRNYRRHYRVIRTRGPLHPDCRCQAAGNPGVVLDPFFGAGTVGLVAEQHHRDWVGIEINPAYAKLAEQRLADARADTKLSTGRRAA